MLTPSPAPYTVVCAKGHVPTRRKRTILLSKLGLPGTQVPSFSTVRSASGAVHALAVLRVGSPHAQSPQSTQSTDAANSGKGIAHATAAAPAASGSNGTERRRQSGSEGCSSPRVDGVRAQSAPQGDGASAQQQQSPAGGDLATQPLARYTKTQLKAMLQLMGCKPRHAHKVRQEKSFVRFRQAAMRTQILDP